MASTVLSTSVVDNLVDSQFIYNLIDSLIYNGIDSVIYNGVHNQVYRQV